jgi:hypothetical protein
VGLMVEMACWWPLFVTLANANSVLRASRSTILILILLSYDY